MSTDRRAERSSGKWRSITLVMLLFSIQSRPVCVYTCGV